MIKKLKSGCAFPSNCDYIFSPILNEKFLKNENIHLYYKQNDRRWFDIQNLILKVCNQMIESKEVIVKTTDTITLLGRVSQHITFERKE